MKTQVVVQFFVTKSVWVIKWLVIKSKCGSPDFTVLKLFVKNGLKLSLCILDIGRHLKCKGFIDSCDMCCNLTLKKSRQNVLTRIDKSILASHHNSSVVPAKARPVWDNWVWCTVFLEIHIVSVRSWYSIAKIIRQKSWNGIWNLVLFYCNLFSVIFFPVLFCCNQSDKVISIKMHWILSNRTFSLI